MLDKLDCTTGTDILIGAVLPAVDGELDKMACSL